ncbi:MAG: 3-dehydroquinate synthase [Desulfamplus sp.]|nr:3-dehydroquinate synthase [Desulfamplus sp.]
MVKIIEVKGSQGVSRIYVGELLKNVSKYLPKGKRCVIITDHNVKFYYENDFPSLPNGSSSTKIPVITISTGEEIKTLQTVEMIFRELIDIGADRSTFILGIGGGIVCDITGFVASIYMRGVDFGFVSTTLLSQVDASVGGKNGVNFDSYKNMIGVFCQPQFVLCDISLLKTLPKEEISNGFAEIVKHALIADAELLEYIETNIDNALALDNEVISKLVEDSVKIKSSVVQKDEKESGERKKLNFGHTLAHALEKIEPIGHGKAVSIGMVAATSFSQNKGLITQNEFLRVKRVLKFLNLPTELNEFKDLDNTIESSISKASLNRIDSSDKDLNALMKDILSAVTKDKKKDNDKISFVFLNRIGNAIVEKITFEDLKTLIFGLFS